MTDLILPPDCLLVCVDETGHEHLAGDHVFYGLGGCGFLMRDYQRIVEGPWRAVRRFVTGSEETPLHASDFGCNATLDQLRAVANFFKTRPFMRIGAAGTASTTLPSSLPLMQVVLGSLKMRIVEVARYAPFRSMAVVFEDNPRANSLVEAYFGDFQPQCDGENIPVDCYLMPKKAHYPALEVADFVANAVGGHARQSLDNRGGFRKDFQAIFREVDRRLVSFVGIEKSN
jgi:hypothetical protein